jgi:hydrogenase/urease accessory protein HupE
VKHAGKFRRAVWVLAVALGLGGAGAARAHDPGLSSATIKLFPEKLEAQLTFAIRDAAHLAQLDTDNNGGVSSEEFEEGKARLGELVSSNFEVRFNDETSKPEDVRCQLDEIGSNAEIFFTVPGKPFTKLSIRSKVISLCPTPDHKQYFMLVNPADLVMAERLLRAGADTVTIEVDAEPVPSNSTNAPPVQTNAVTSTPATNSSAQTNATSPTPIRPATSEAARVSFGEFLKIGIDHIVTGYDHLLFLFALLIVTRNPMSALKVITCFTIAHSITLAMATLNWVQVPSKIAEPLVALSIVYVGVENILRKGDPHKRWILTFVFGLIHGFGFASVLREMGIAARPGGVLMPLFSFNLGVEVGQIIIAALVLPLIWQVRKHPQFLRYGVPACSGLVAIAGGIWFVQRVWFPV